MGMYIQEDGSTGQMQVPEYTHISQKEPSNIANNTQRRLENVAEEDETESDNAQLQKDMDQIMQTEQNITVD